MSFVRALRIFLAFTLLSAQQVALAHQIWHLGDHDTQPAQNQLCDQHDALGTVAGGLDCPIALIAGKSPSAIFYRTASLPAVSTPGLAPSSRGPPTLL
jgi:hypothetical protein